MVKSETSCASIETTVMPEGSDDRTSAAGSVPVRFEAATGPVTLIAVVAVAALPLMLMAAVPALKFAGFKLVRPEPLPLKLAAVMVEPEKLPEASRSTIVLAEDALVAALAARAPRPRWPPFCPPTLATTVAPCVPVTSPVSEPEKLLAVAAVVALPPKLPVNVPLKRLLGLVAIVTPAKLFVPLNALVPLSCAMFVESCASETLPIKFVAVVAVAALPLMLMAAVPALKFAGFKLVRPEPLPLNWPP